MFKNSDNDNDTKAVHTCSGRAFREVPLANLFKDKYKEKCFYNGEEVDLMDEKHSKPIREEEDKSK